MTTPPNTAKAFAMYALGYALSIVALVLDVRHGVAIFALAGFAGSVVVTTLILYRAARAMAFSPMAAQPRTVPVRVSADSQRLAA